MLFKESVKKDDALIVSKAKVVSVAVAWSFGGINDEYLLQREVEALCKRYYLILKPTILEVLIFIEQGHYHIRDKVYHNESGNDRKSKEVDVKLLSSILNHCHESIVNRSAKQEGQNDPFEFVRNEKVDCRFVKTMILFQYKRLK
jgi:hypothetical protein